MSPNEILEKLVASPEEQIAKLKEDLEIANTVVLLQKRAMISVLGGGKMVAFTGDLEIPGAPERVEFYLNFEEDSEDPFVDMRDADGE